MEHSEQIEAQRSYRLLVVIVIVLLLAGTGAFSYLRAEKQAAVRHERYVAAQDKLSDMLLTGEQVQSAKNDLAQAGARYIVDYSAGVGASEKRHDNSVTGSPDTDYMYAEAKEEYSSVNKLNDDSDRLDSAYESVANAFAARYGDQAVSKLRSDTRLANEAAEDSISNWSRAIGNIKDQLQREEEGGWALPESDTDTLYQTSDESQSRAERHWTDATSDVAALQKRLDADTSNAKKFLNALPK